MLVRLHHRFGINPRFTRLYSEFLQEYEDLQHMSRIPLQPKELGYFLPHHGVLKESSTTTKLRVVFNGSCQTASGASLNEYLHVGPKLQNDIFDVILRWRMHPYVFCADIEKMYRQIVVNPEDRRYQQILWSVAGDPNAYQLNTVTYGLNCAPYLAIRVLHQLARDEGPRYPIASNVLLHEMYVDDVLSGDDTIALAQSKVVQLDRLLMAGGFTLHKWTSNDAAVLKPIDARRHATSSTREFRSDSFVRALGLLWNQSSDQFIIQPRFTTASHDLTKRLILSRVAQIFDPLGWITPITIGAKIFIQDLWKLKLNWDDPLPHSYAMRWAKFEDALRSTTLQIPRWLGTAASTLALELHGFSDASVKALGAVVYLRVIDTSDNTRVSLLAAKSKVAPLKPVTIPRLELSAAVLLVRLITRIQIALKFERVPVHVWVDSNIVLAWMQGHPSRWKEFVANRVALMRELLPAAQWHHVSGEENPADCASRGLSPDALLNFHLWWSGPAWLCNPSTSWPTDAPPMDSTQDLEERPVRVNTALLHAPDMWELVHRYSSLSRLIRITAWLRCAIARFRRSTVELRDTLTTSELLDAELWWVKEVQSTYFASEIKALSRGIALSNSNSLSRLVPFIDSQGLLRVGGRLRNSLLDPDAKHPMVLPQTSAYWSHTR